MHHFFFIKLFFSVVLQSIKQKQQNLNLKQKIKSDLNLS